MLLQSTLLALALAQSVLSQCNANNCARGVDGTRTGKTPDVTSRQADCSSFMLTTVTPAVSTVYATVTGPPTTLFGKKRREVAALEQRQVTIIPSVVPAYATACSGAAGYSSACSCWGITAATTTAPTPVTTTTVTVPGPTTECGLEGYGTASYEIGSDRPASSGENCRQQCLSTPNCVSFAYGLGVCGLFNEPTSKNVVPEESGYLFYDISCPDTFASKKMIRAGAKAAIARDVHPIAI